MTKTCAWVIFALLVVQGYAAPTNDTHLIKVERARKSLMNQASVLSSAADELDSELAKFQKQSENTVKVRTVITNMLANVAAWSELNARDTRRHDGAKKRLEGLLKEARGHLDSGKKELAALKKAEYEAWARANPEAAMQLELQKRIAAAESAAQTASIAAQMASREAEDAARTARNAQMQAQEAERKAKDTERRTNDTLWRHGIMP